MVEEEGAYLAERNPFSQIVYHHILMVDDHSELVSSKLFNRPVRGSPDSGTADASHVENHGVVMHICCKGEVILVVFNCKSSQDDGSCKQLFRSKSVL